jgi:hypothetical protein
MKAHKKTRIKGLIFLHNPSVHSKTYRTYKLETGEERRGRRKRGNGAIASDSHPAFVVVLLCKSFFWWLTSRA